MIQEIKDAFTVTLAKRLSSPFLSSFFLALAVTNYDIVLLVFSGNDWNTKVTYISSVAGSTDIHDHRIVWPISVAFLYVTLWPGFDMALYAVSKYWSIGYKNLQLKLEGKTPLSKEERQALEDKLNESENTYRDKITKKDAQIVESDKQYKSALETISQNKEEIDSLNKMLDGKNKEIFDLADELGKKWSRIDPEEVIDNSITDPVEIPKNLKPNEVLSEEGVVFHKEINLYYDISDKFKNELVTQNRHPKYPLMLSFGEGEIPENIHKTLVNYKLISETGLNNDPKELFLVEYYLGTSRSLKDMNSTWKLHANPLDLSDIGILKLWHSEFVLKMQEINSNSLKTKQEDIKGLFTRAAKSIIEKPIEITSKIVSAKKVETIPDRPQEKAFDHKIESKLSKNTKVEKVRAD